MKKTSITARKLSRRKETLRTLDEAQLPRAAGGAFNFWLLLSGSYCRVCDDGNSAGGVRG